MFDLNKKNEIELLRKEVERLEKKVKDLREELCSRDKANEKFIAYYKRHFKNVLSKKYKQAVQIITTGKMDCDFGLGFRKFILKGLTIKETYNSMVFYGSKDRDDYKYFANLGDFEFPEDVAKELHTLCFRYLKKK